MLGDSFFWWSNDRNPEFLDEELNNLFVYGQNSNIINSEIGTKLTGDDYDVGLSIKEEFL